MAQKSSLVVAVLGASGNPERYSNKAIRMLQDHGHHVIPVNPALKSVEGLPVVPNLGALAKVSPPPHTVTVYVGPRHIGAVLDDLVALRPERVIINPGAESPELAARLRAADIKYVEACTLVMLRTNQF